MFNGCELIAAIDPHKNNNESPGKNGVTTKPVSVKIIKNRPPNTIYYPAVICQQLRNNLT